MESIIKSSVFPHTGMQSGSNVNHRRTGWKEPDSFRGMTPSILSPGTDLLILKGQTGPIHNVTLECWGLSFHCNEKAIYWHDSCRGSICFPQFWTFCYYSDKLTLYPVTSDSFSIALTCSQFRKIFELVRFHSIFPGGWLGAVRHVIIQTQGSQMNA